MWQCAVVHNKNLVFELLQESKVRILELSGQGRKPRERNHKRKVAQWLSSK
nr:MAG TPA: hypothetical protein [Caudoviricetes sp.]